MTYSSGNNKHFGLTKISTSEESINETNVVDIATKALNNFKVNQNQIIELKEIYCGKQAILERTNDKTTINEKVNINILPTIITTIAGLYLGEKVDYVYVGLDENESVKLAKQKDITLINRYMRYCGDILCDKNSLIEMLISGVAYQFCSGNDEKNKPFLLTNIPSENCFVIQSTKVGFPVLATCIYSNENNLVNKKDGDNEEILTVFTEDMKYVLVNGNKGWEINREKSMQHECPCNPIQMIKFNDYGLSLVAQLESIQNAFNVTISDSINSTIEHIRAMLVVLGAEITKENAEIAKQTGILNATATDGRNITAQYIAKPIDENINSLRQFLFDIALFVAGVPTQSTGGSGNNGAVAMASGFFGANISAYFNELEYQQPKQCQIDNVISALRRAKIITSDISSFDIEIRFDRNKLTSLKEAADALAILLSNKIPTRDALKVVGIFGDVDRIANEMEKIKQQYTNAVVDGLVNNNQEGVTDNETKQNQMSELQ